MHLGIKKSLMEGGGTLEDMSFFFLSEPYSICHTTCASFQPFYLLIIFKKSWDDFFIKQELHYEQR